MRVDAKLDKVSREVRITSAAGDPSDVTLAVTPGDPSRVWLAWSDPRESPSEGLGDIYVAQLRAQDANRTGDEVRLLTTATTRDRRRSSRCPQGRTAEGPSLRGSRMAPQASSARRRHDRPGRRRASPRRRCEEAGAAGRQHAHRSHPCSMTARAASRAPSSPDRRAAP